MDTYRYQTAEERVATIRVSGQWDRMTQPNIALNAVKGGELMQRHPPRLRSDQITSGDYYIEFHEDATRGQYYAAHWVETKRYVRIARPSQSDNRHTPPICRGTREEVIAAMKQERPLARLVARPRDA
jgi:hypothetical protein